MADSFQREFEALGGTVTRRALNPEADALDLLNSVTAAGLSPTLVYFGGLTDGGAPRFRQAMVETIRAEFEQHYRAAYGDVPVGPFYDYTAASYACVEIVIASLDAARGVGSDPSALCEAVRAHGGDPTSSFDSVVGPVSFDANGDSVHQVVSFYKVDPAAAGGLGDWVIVKKQDFGPAP